MNEVTICIATPAYVYEEDTGPLKGQRVETHLTFRYLAKDGGEAIRMAVAHARERYQEYYKDSYKNCFLGSIKVGTESIGRIDMKTGTGSSSSMMPIFEWKYDWPETLDECVERTLKGKGN